MNGEKAIPEYTESFALHGYECDGKHRMLLSTALRYAQEVAGKHCAVNGITANTYAETHTAFLLAKLAIEFEKVPTAWQTISVRTCPQDMHRAVYKRLNYYTDSAGEQVALMDSRWVLVDTESRRILRQAPPAMQRRWHETVEGELEQTIHHALAPEQVDVCRASYTLCDENGHLNNCRYADIVLDALPTEELEQKNLRRFAIAYHREVPMGETFALFRGRTESGSWYVKGVREEKVCFEAELELI